MHSMMTQWMRGWLAVALAAGLWSATGGATDLPGKGISVQPLQSSLPEETFQTLIVIRALERLGYDVKPIQQMEYADAYVAIAEGKATFMAAHWHPIDAELYARAGGDAKLYREGAYILNCLQGYLIDKATAQQHHITRLDQLKDPQLARLFDIDSDGKADLAGCNKGWACEETIDYQLKAYGLQDTVVQIRSDYTVLITDTIARFRKGQPVLYFAWTPYWVPAAMVPGRDVVWLQVPFSALPGERQNGDTTLPDGKNYGYNVNHQHIVANRAFAEEHPDAAKLFAVMKVSTSNINTQNLLMYHGEKSEADIERHVQEWIGLHQQTFDGWIQDALEAASGRN